MKTKIIEKFRVFSAGVYLASGINSSTFQSLKNVFGGAAASPAGAATLGDLILFIVQILLAVAASIAVIFLIIGGFQYVTAHGNEEQSESAKKTMQSAILGLAVIIMSFVTILIVSSILLEGREGLGIP